MMNRIILVTVESLLLLGIFLGGCSTGASPQPLVYTEIVPIQKVIGTSESTNTPPCTELVTVPSEHFSTSVSGKISQECVEWVNEMPNTLMFSQGIIRYCKDQQRICTLFASEHKLAEKVITPTDVYPGSNPGISKDGRWLAYMELSKDFKNIVTLWVISFDSKQQFQVSWKPHWQKFTRWIDNSQLQIIDNDGNFIKYNPFSEAESMNYRPDEPPDMDFGNSVFSGVMVESPDNQKYVYLDIYGNYALVDSKTEKILWSRKAGPQLIANLSSIKWSPDGKMVAITAEGIKGGELYVIDEFGVLITQTNLSTTYPSAYFLIGDFEWSPSGNLIALWVNFGTNDVGGDVWSFYTLDVNTGVIIDYCVQSDGLGAHDHFPFSYWSPDSKQIVLQYYLGRDPLDTVQTIIGVSDKKAVSLPIGNKVIGWMTTP